MDNLANNAANHRQNNALDFAAAAVDVAGGGNKLQWWVPASIAIAVVYALVVGVFIRSRRARQAGLTSGNLEKPVAGLSELHRRRKLTREVTDAGWRR